jgi:hypothetical protein
MVWVCSLWSPSMTEFLCRPTIRALAGTLATAEVVDSAPLVAAQWRLWRSHRQRVDPDVCHVAHRVDLGGSSTRTRSAGRSRRSCTGTPRDGAADVAAKAW